VTRLSDGTLVSQWEESVDPITEAEDLNLAWSSDNGRRGRSRSIRIMTGRNRSTPLRRSSSCKAAHLAWSGSTGVKAPKATIQR
jgi:hypothetical protein